MNMRKAVQPVAENFRNMGARYNTQAVAVSSDIISILDQVSLRSNDEPLDDATKAFLVQALDMVKGGQAAVPAVQNFQQEIRRVHGRSRAIRHPLLFMDEGVLRFLDAQDLLDALETSNSGSARRGSRNRQKRRRRRCACAVGARPSQHPLATRRIRQSPPQLDRDAFAVAGTVRV